MSPAELVKSYWEAMNTNDFAKAAELFADDYLCLWPQSGELIRGRNNFVEINSRYPSAGKWKFETDIFGTKGNEVLSITKITDGTVTTRAITLTEVENGQIVKQTEYWADSYPPPEWRKEWVEYF